MRVLVVGGAGYIGSHTAKLLRKKGHEPEVLDDLSTGHEEAVKYGPFHRGSYADAAFVEKLLRERKIETVMHFGAKSLVAESVDDPLLYYAANTGGTVALLQAMRDAGVRNIVFSSTCATYGEPREVPIQEGAEQKPINPYGQSKLFVEKILKDCDTRWGIKSAVLRYFNAAGADPDGELGEDHRPESHLIPRILRVALGLEPKLVVHGRDYPTKDGSCVRDYVHVNDLAEAHVAAMELTRETGKSYEFNLGTEQGSSVLEVIEAARKVTGHAIPVEHGPRRPGDPPVLIGDCTRARTKLGWKRRFDLEAMVETAWRWHRSHPRGFSG